MRKVPDLVTVERLPPPNLFFLPSACVYFLLGLVVPLLLSVGALTHGPLRLVTVHILNKPTLHVLHSYLVGSSFVFEAFVSILRIFKVCLTMCRDLGLVDR